MKREEEQNENLDGESNQEVKANRTESSPRSGRWLPELSFTAVLSIVGIGFTAFDIFMRYRQSIKTGKAENEDNKNRIVDLSQVPPTPQPIKMELI